MRRVTAIAVVGALLLAALAVTLAWFPLQGLLSFVSKFRVDLNNKFAAGYA